MYSSAYGSYWVKRFSVIPSLPPESWVGDVETLTLDFEGLCAQIVYDNLFAKNLFPLEEINDFYNGGKGSLNAASGFNYGIEFTNGATGIIDSDAGGMGNIAGEPSPNTVMFWLTTDVTPYMNFPNGFLDGVSLYYSSSEPGAVEIYSDLNGTGSLLGTLTLAANHSVSTPGDPDGDGFPNLSGDPAGDFLNWSLVSTTFAGVAKSLKFIGASNQIGFDNLSIGYVKRGVLDLAPILEARATVGQVVKGILRNNSSSAANFSLTTTPALTVTPASGVIPADSALEYTFTPTISGKHIVELSGTFSPGGGAIGISGSPLVLNVNATAPAASVLMSLDTEEGASGEPVNGTLELLNSGSSATFSLSSSLGGTFSPTSGTLTAGVIQAFTFTPTTTGNHLISAVIGSGVAAPMSLVLLVISSPMPKFTNVQLYMLGNGLDAQPLASAIADSSKYAQSVLTVGTVTTVTSNPLWGQSSILYSASGSYNVCSIVNDPFYRSFSVDAFVRLSGYPSADIELVQTATLGFMLGVKADGRLYYKSSHNGTTISFTCVSGTTIPLAAWSHICICADTVAKRFRMFIDGVVAVDTSYQTYVAEMSAGLHIGPKNSSVTMPSMQLKALRVAVDEAAFTLAFTPVSSAPVDTTISKTMVLLTTHGDNNSQAIVDSGPYARRISVIGSPILSTTQTLFSPTSIFIPPTAIPLSSIRTNQAITVSAGAAITIDAWIYANSAFDGNKRFIAQLGRGSGKYLALIVNAGKLGFEGGLSDGSVTQLLTNGQDVVNLPIGSWVHVALVYSAGSISVYRSGVRVAGPTAWAGFTQADCVFCLGYNHFVRFADTAYDVDNTTLRDCYLTEVRLKVGAAMYTGSTLTVPTGPFLNNM